MYLEYVLDLVVEVADWIVLVSLVQMGTTAIGIRTKEGVVLAVEKRLTSTLLEPGRCVYTRRVVL